MFVIPPDSFSKITVIAIIHPPRLQKKLDIVIHLKLVESDFNKTPTTVRLSASRLQKIYKDDYKKYKDDYVSNKDNSSYIVTTPRTGRR